MKCPIDGRALRAQAYEAGIQVDVCPHCGGMWLDQGELESIQEVRERDYTEELARLPDLGYQAFMLAAQKTGRTLACPKGHGEMETREYARVSQVMIDVCPRCHGVWLDRGEIEALEQFFERSRLDTAGMRRHFLVGLRPAR